MFQSNRLHSAFADAVVSHLRAQSTSLRTLIEKIEVDKNCDESYIKDSIKDIEQDIRRLRKIIEHDCTV